MSLFAEWGPFRRVFDSPTFEAVSRHLEAVDDARAASTRPLALSGLVEAGRALAVTFFAVRARRRVLVVVHDDAAMEALKRDVAAISALVGRDPSSVMAFPALDADPYDGIAPHPEVARRRVAALSAIAHGEVTVLITPARALATPLPAPTEWRRVARAVRPGDDLPPDRFVLDCLAFGYKRVDTVSAPGEVSRRGGIVDVFPPESHEPVRIELFGDTVDSLRSFDTDHQRSTGALAEARVGPASENPPSEEAIARLVAYLRAGLADDDDPKTRRQTIDALTEEGYFPGLEGLTAIMAERPSTLFDHAAGFALVVDEPERVDEAAVRFDYELRQSYAQSGDRVLPPPDRLFVEVATVRERLAAPAVELRELAGEEPAERVVHRVACRTARSFAGRTSELAEALRETVHRGEVALCVLRAEGGADRLREILVESGLRVAGDGTPGVSIRVGGLRGGFELPELGLSVFTEREIFGEARKQRARPTRGQAAFVSDFRDLKRGDSVVHVDHGVATFVGLGRPKGGSLNRDFMVLEFAGGDQLFVPVDRLDLVQKYSGVGSAKPSVDKLGGTSWNRVKSRVRKSVRSMAAELLKLYARRQAARGHAFAPDSEWQRELEDAFPFELTEDQARALAEAKTDMESPRPMDRLLVGDVGFGKTEIAVRAAFKAVMDGKQVALLAPTTVLAFQHYETFRRRYAAFPVRVEMVSRFRSAAENREVARLVASGEVDVLIGTHRLLSKDVEFQRLGLLVVDEEQRFGVAHKERLKKLSVGVDALAMSATPIPRTLQMSLAGVRDLSIIRTPPPGRSAIQTYIVPWRSNVLAAALRQEIRREGQVFVVHNRVETLPALARAIREMVPEARIVVAHGQMREKRLEEVMMRFVDYEADVLVTTTIIENGLDIPRANTIIVNRADRFGLAQLYQLRGRVGRSERHAYAYFVVPARAGLSDTARRRLRALQEFSDLGAGFRLAAADLEIRGAGELLGSRQHGHIAALGFDLYCRMLESAVREARGEAPEEHEPVSLHLGVDFKIPDRYMPDAGDRLALYKRVAGCREESEIDAIEAELEDRYGPPPAAAHNLFRMARLRLVAERVGATRVDVAEGRLQIRFSERAGVDPQRLIALVEARGGQLTPSGMLIVPVGAASPGARAPAGGRPPDRIEAAREILTSVA